MQKWIIPTITGLIGSLLGAALSLILGFSLHWLVRAPASAEIIWPTANSTMSVSPTVVGTLRSKRADRDYWVGLSDPNGTLRNCIYAPRVADFGGGTWQVSFPSGVFASQYGNVRPFDLVLLELDPANQQRFSDAVQNTPKLCVPQGGARIVKNIRVQCCSDSAVAGSASSTTARTAVISTTTTAALTGPQAALAQREARVLKRERDVGIRELNARATETQLHAEEQMTRAREQNVFVREQKLKADETRVAAREKLVDTREKAVTLREQNVQKREQKLSARGG